MRAVGFPLLFLLATFLAWHASSFAESTTAAWIAYGAFVLTLAWLAITIHRLVLVDGWSRTPASGSMPLRRFAWFVAALMLIWLLHQALTLIVVGLALNLIYPPRYVPAGEIQAPPREMQNVEWLGTLAYVLVYWVIARVSMVLPAIAVDRKLDVVDSWRRSRGNGWKLAIIVGVLPWVLERSTAAL